MRLGVIKCCLQKGVSLFVLADYREKKSGGQTLFDIVEQLKEREAATVSLLFTSYAAFITQIELSIHTYS